MMSSNIQIFWKLKQPLKINQPCSMCSSSILKSASNPHPKVIAPVIEMRALQKCDTYWQGFCHGNSFTWPIEVLRKARPTLVSHTVLVNAFDDQRVCVGGFQGLFFGFFKTSRVLWELPSTPSNIFGHKSHRVWKKLSLTWGEPLLLKFASLPFLTDDLVHLSSEMDKDWSALHKHHNFWENSEWKKNLFEGWVLLVTSNTSNHKYFNPTLILSFLLLSIRGDTWLNSIHIPIRGSHFLSINVGERISVMIEGKFNYEYTSVCNTLCQVVLIFYLFIYFWQQKPQRAIHCKG